ncbi:MAG: hypothetical protein RH946_16605 [Rhodospirillales bacterium]
MTGRCENPHCDYPDVQCAIGEPDATKCKHLSIRADDEGNEQAPDRTLFPWTGRTLGLNDLHFVAGRKKPQTVGVIGMAAAGKTTLLGALYLLICRGEEVFPGHVFAGSFSLDGWENIASFLRLTPGQRITFPPHTTTSSERGPGLLHLRMSDVTSVYRDFLFTDAPGEWFSKWSYEAEAREAEGARWIAENADRFALFADCKALSGPNAGKVRGDLQFLIRRLAASLGGRPLALVWSKSDHALDGETQDAIRELLSNSVASFEEFSISVKCNNFDEGSEYVVDVDALKSLFHWMLSSSVRRVSVAKIQPSVWDDCFLAYGSL